MQILALIDISAGQELTHSYTDLTNCRDIRQHNLNCIYGFQCDCRRCSFTQRSLTDSTSQAQNLQRTICARLQDPLEIRELLKANPDSLSEEVIESLITSLLTTDVEVGKIHWAV
jgi:hypothetical protein